MEDEGNDLSELLSQVKTGVCLLEDHKMSGAITCYSFMSVKMLRLTEKLQRSLRPHIFNLPKVNM